MSKQDKYTKSAKGQPCQIRIPGVCKPAPENETTVLAHLNGAGMSVKHHSIHGAYACNKCHDVVDGRAKSEWAENLIVQWHLEGMVRTQIIMIREGILKL